jgi:hypothetical protein
MLNHSRARALGKWRRWTFRIWVSITIALAGYILVMLAFFRDERFGQFAVGLPVPFVMILLLALGLGWLIWLITSRRRRVSNGDQSHHI